MRVLALPRADRSLDFQKRCACTHDLPCSFHSVDNVSLVYSMNYIDDQPQPVEARSVQAAEEDDAASNRDLLSNPNPAPIGPDEEAGQTVPMLSIIGVQELSGHPVFDVSDSRRWSAAGLGIKFLDQAHAEMALHIVPSASEPSVDADDFLVDLRHQPDLFFTLGKIVLIDTQSVDPDKSHGLHISADVK